MSQAITDEIQTAVDHRAQVLNARANDKRTDAERRADNAQAFADAVTARLESQSSTQQPINE